MKRRTSCLIVPFSTLAAFLLLVPIAGDSPGLPGHAALASGAPVVSSVQMQEVARAKVVSSYGELPLSFEPNQGQTNERVKFMSRGGGYSIFLTEKEVVLALRGVTESTARKGKERARANAAAKSDVLRMKLIGANANSRVIGLNELPGKSNYLIGSSADKWHVNVPNYANVRYEDVYPGIDLVYYGNQRQLEYDFVVAPGADPKAITLEIAGTKPSSPLYIAENGDLLLKTADGEVRFHAPVVYQTGSSSEVTSSRKSIDGRFVLLGGNRIGFEVSSYDVSKPLYIDPVVSYSTYLGKGFSWIVGGWYPWSITVDSEGNAYVAGGTESPEFPVTEGAFHTTPSSYGSAFVTKLSADGSTLVYSTFLGGSGRSEVGGIAVDSAGNAYVSGATDSSDFPTLNAFQGQKGGEACASSDWTCYDAFVSKLNSTGSALLYSTYLGGSVYDSAYAVTLDQSGNVYVAGGTTSEDFPLLNPIQQTFHSNCEIIDYGDTCEDGFVAKINPSASGEASLLYSTYLGGNGTDWLGSIAVDSSGNAYISGSTYSTDFPTTTGALQTSGSGAFVAKVNSTGTALVYSTLIGSAYGPSIAVDTSGNAYITGSAWAGFATTPGAFDTTCGSDGQCDGGGDAFVAKLNPAGSGFVYSTYLGGSGYDYASGIAVDSMGFAYVTGGTGSQDFPLANAIYSACHFNDGYCSDSFLAKVNAGGDGLVFSTYLGGSGSMGVALDPSRNAYVGGQTYSTNFPVTPGAYQQTPEGDWSGFVVKFADLVLPSIVQSAKDLNFGNQDVGTTSAAQTVTIKNVGDAAASALSFNITGDFQFTQTCASSIPPGSGCTMDVTFTPQAGGTRTGEVKKYNDMTGQWETFLSVVGFGGNTALAVSPVSLAFEGQLLGTSSAAKTITVTNTGALPVRIASIESDPNFPYTSKCGNSIDSGKNCTLSVAFVPMAVGVMAKEIVIAHDGVGSPYTISVSGQGTDFSVGGESGTASLAQSVRAGEEATYGLRIDPAGYLGTVSMACQWNNMKPSGASCSVAPAAVSLDGKNPSSVIVRITTRARSMLPVGWEPGAPEAPSSPVSYTAMLLLGLATLASLALRRRRIFLTFVSTLFLVVLWAACSGSVSTPLPVTGTPAGTYSLTLTSTASSVTKTTPITLEVK